ncbi:MAG: hypothetical protein ACTSSE_18200 [Candidatus Thorarchaeota archaeon]
MSVIEFIADFCFNTLILSGTIWSVLKVIEKAFDVLLKSQQYEAHPGG